jgi:hypothetical protein
LRFHGILIDFLKIEKSCGIQLRFLQNINKSCGIQLRQSIFFFKAMKSVGIQLRFLVIYKMSIGIQKSINFNGFLYGMNFARLFS